jgi:hypothetical protein
MKKLKT